MARKRRTGIPEATARRGSRGAVSAVSTSTLTPASRSRVAIERTWVSTPPTWGENRGTTIATLSPANLPSGEEVAAIRERAVSGQRARGAVDPEVCPRIAGVPRDERGDRREATRDDGRGIAVPRALVAARLGRPVLGDHDRLAAGVVGVDAVRGPEPGGERLPGPAAPVVAVDPHPVDIGVARVIRRPVIRGGVGGRVGDVRGPHPDHVASPLAREDVMHAPPGPHVVGRAAHGPRAPSAAPS